MQEMVNRGILTVEQAARHPDANRITRALGVAPEVEIELRPQPVVQVTGDTFVLCSDGMSDMLEDQEILAIVGTEPPAQAVGRLVDLANARGGHDNITVAVLRAREGAVASTGALPPTVAQTGVSGTQAPDTVPTPPVVALDASAGPRATVPAFPSVHVPHVPPHPDGPLPRSTHRPRRPANPAVLVGIALASVALVLLTAVMMAHRADRRGRSGTPSSTTLPASPEAR